MIFPSRATRESPLLDALRERRSGEGWWLAEFPLGRPGESRSWGDRRLDALVLPEHRPSRGSPQDQDLDEVDDLISSQPVELIEAKAWLDVDAIGQLLCGAAMFKAKYPNHGPMTLTAVVGGATDGALRWCCEQLGIDLVVLGEVWHG